MRVGRAVVALAAFLGASGLFAQGAPGRPAIRVSVTDAPLRIDGVLNEPAWQLADSIVSLTQVEPVQGGRPSARTVVRVLATPDVLVFGVRAEYAPDVPVVSYARSRDATLDNEDHVKLVLDTFGDGRSGYVFAVNANGARYDALVSGDGGSENANWDAIWEAATARTANGWSAEIVIPIKSLLFRPGVTEWGLNMQRRIQALQETDRWVSAAQNYKVTQTSRAGILAGLPAFSLGAGLSVRPSATAGFARDTAGRPARDRSHASLDLTQRIGTGSLASLTVNTDFAETEVDNRRVNLTRFPLFFPEKRTFFLEGADLFDFGLGLNQDVVPFFSRRIGLYEGTQVPLDVGLKVNGRVAGSNYGALVARTSNVDTLTSAATLGVVRVKRNVLGESSLGFIATSGDPTGRPGAWLAGPDFTYQTSHFNGDKNLRVGVWGLGVGRDGLSGDRSAAGVTVQYPNDVWDAGASYKRIGDAFDPPLGFVPRAGVHLVTATVNWQPRPEHAIGPLHVRQCFWENELTYVSGLAGGWQSYRYFMAPINCRFESGDRVEFNIVPTGERITEPFEVSSGVSVPAGSYHFRRYRLEGGLAAKREFSAQATWWFGGFYDGSLDQFLLTGSWKPSAVFIVDFNGEHDVGRISAGRFVRDVLGTSLRVNVSPDLSFDSFVQYDNASYSIGTTSRLRWTFQPAGDLFVVYNHNLSTLHSRGSFASNALQVKVQYAFRY